MWSSLICIRTSPCPVASKSTSPSTAPSPSPKHTPTSLPLGHTSAGSPSIMDICNSRKSISFLAPPPTERAPISSSPNQFPQATKAVFRSSSPSIPATLPRTELGNTFRSRVPLDPKTRRLYRQGIWDWGLYKSSKIVHASSDGVAVAIKSLIR